MAAEDDKKPETAGLSSPTVDVAAVFERLKEEVRRGPTDVPGVPPENAPPARVAAERLWPVAVDVPIDRGRGVRGRLVYLVKRMLQKLMSWYVGPFAAAQRNFNAASLKVADGLYERVDELRLSSERSAHEAAERLERLERLEATRPSLEPEVAESARRLEELDDRLLRLERRARTAATTPDEQKPDAAGSAPDYFAFEARMRGSTTEVEANQQMYVDGFRGQAPVLDIGCGRGEFLRLLADAGIEARGVDTDADMVDFCRGAGLDVELGDGLSYLAGLRDDALGGIFCAHVLEHLEPPNVMRLLELARAKLRPGGLFVAETPNPRTLITLSTFSADLSHAQPLHPETLVYLAKQAGLRDVQLRYLNPPPDEGRLRPVPLPEEQELEATKQALDANVERLNEVIFGPQDFAVLARSGSAGGE